MLSSFAGEHDGVVVNPHVLRRMLGLLRPHAARMVLAATLTLVTTATSLLAPYLMKVAIDTNIAAGDRSGLIRTSVLLLLTYAAMFGARIGQGYTLSWVGNRVLTDLRAQLVRHVTALHLGYHDDHIVGVTISRVVNDVAVINQVLSEGLISFIADILMLVGIVVVMLAMDASLALLTFTVIPVMVLATVLFGRGAKSAYRSTRATVASVIGDLAESIGGMRVIQAFSREEHARDRFSEKNRANRDSHVRAMSLAFVFIPVVEFLGVVATALVLYFGGRAVAAEAVTLGVLVAFLSYVVQFFQPIRELSQLYSTMQSAMAGGEQVFRLLDTEPAVADAPDAAELGRPHGEIRFEGVSLSYVPEVEVLHDVSFQIDAGATVALVGPTGAGKSSIASLIARFYDVSAGRITIDGRDVRSVTQRSLHRSMALVPQDPFLFAGTIAENIRYGYPDATDEEVVAAAKGADAHAFIEALPNGYETRVLEGAVNLSVGQRQLVSIARAVLADPAILILDEATSNVDTVTEQRIQASLEHLLSGRTAVVIAHRLSTIEKADQILVVRDGRIAEMGRHAELLAADGVYADLHRKNRLTD